MVLVVKNLPTDAGDIRDWVPSLGQEDPLEDGMSIYSSILACRVHGPRSLVGYSPWGCKELDTPEAT